LSTYPEVHLELAVGQATIDIVAKGFDAGIGPRDRVPVDMIAVRAGLRRICSRMRMAFGHGRSPFCGRWTRRILANDRRGVLFLRVPALLLSAIGCQGTDKGSGKLSCRESFREGELSKCGLKGHGRRIQISVGQY
jgi:hypothetical protein